MLLYRTSHPSSHSAHLQAMSDRHLKTYLQDHLAGSETGVRLAKHCVAENRGQPLGDYARRLLRNLEADRVIVLELLDRLDAGTAPVRRSLSLMTATFAQLRLSRLTHGELGRFETVEGLVVLINGRRALWRALEVLAERDRRLKDLPFASLAHRAKQDLDEAEAHRLALARLVFEPRATSEKRTGLRRLVPIRGA